MRSGFAVKRTAAAPFSVKSVQLGAVSSMLKTIRLERITKRFPGVLACDDVSLTIRPGIVHAIVGENGAGKSTLMGILAGLHQPDAGSIYINDARVRFTSPRDAVAKALVWFTRIHAGEVSDCGGQHYPRLEPPDSVIYREMRPSGVYKS